MYPYVAKPINNAEANNPKICFHFLLFSNENNRVIKENPTNKGAILASSTHRAIVNHQGEVINANIIKKVAK